MTGRTGRGVRRTVPIDKKQRELTIPTPDTTERDAVLDRLRKERK